MHPDAIAMQSAMQQHRRGRSLSTTRNERDEDLALFHEMQKRERERKSSIHSPGEAEAPSPTASHKSSSHSLYRVPASTTPGRSKGADDIFTSDWDKNDYDWLLTPPGTPLIPALDHDLSTGLSLTGSTPSVRSLAPLKTSRLGNSKSEPPSRSEPSARIVRGNLGLQQPTKTSAGPSGSTIASSRRSLSSSSNSVSRPSTPSSNGVGRPSTPSSASMARPSTPSSASMVRPSTPSSSSMARPSTPNSNSLARPSTPSSSMGAQRLSTSGTNSGARPSTPSKRASIPSTRPVSSSRPSTPVRRPSTPNHQSNPPNTLARSSSVSKSSPMPSKGAVSSRASSPTTRNQAWQPAALPGFSEEPPPNLRTSMPERSISNMRGSSVGSRPGAPTTARTTQTEAPDSGARIRRQSSSPLLTKGRLSSDSQNGDKPLNRNGKVHDVAASILASSAIGSKIVDKTIRSRKPTPSAQEEQVNSHVKRPMKSTPMLRDVKSTITSARESSGFGRNLSKKSLDMALRHMDIRRSTPTGFHSFMSNVPASSLYSVRSDTGRGRSINSAADSPMATSSNASSEHCMSIVLDPEGSEHGDEAVASEKVSKLSPASQPDLLVSMSKERGINSWLGSPDYRDSSAEIMQFLKQDMERLSGSESPLVSQHDGIAGCDNFTLELI